MNNSEKAYDLIQKINRTMLLRTYLLWPFCCIFFALYIVFIPFVFLYSLAYSNNPIGHFCDIWTEMSKMHVDRIKVIKYSYWPHKYKTIANAKFVDDFSSFKLKKICAMATENFIIVKQVLAFDIISKENVAWVYKKKRQSSDYIGRSVKISSSSLNELIIKTFDKKTYSILLNEVGFFFSSLSTMDFFSEVTFEDLMHSCHNAVFGYSKEYEKIYRRNPANFAKIIREERFLLDK